MHRFYIAPEDWNPDALVLSEAEAHHARDVLRLKQGDKVVVFNGRGREVTAEIIDRGRGEIRLRKFSESDTPPLRCRIALAQAVPKGKNMELIVQKAVEIGASEIFPLISERTIVDLDPDEAAQKQAKWQTVAIEAAKQCGQNWLPQVYKPQKLKTFFEQATTAFRCDSGRRLAVESSDPSRATGKSPLLDFDLRLIGSLQPGAMHLKKILADYCSEHRHLPERVLMLIGPEGDFTPAEIALARTHVCLPITLGPIVLRVETAAIYCLSVLSYELL
ncbi:MAG: 16S rRNA (uracil(1498)-N(3))-methyltransferase [Chthoniobacterales bacterium]